MARLTKAKKFDNELSGLEMRGYFVKKQQGNHYALLKNKYGEVKVIGKKTKY